MENHARDIDIAAERNFMPSASHLASGAVAAAIYVCHHRDNACQIVQCKDDEKPKNYQEHICFLRKNKISIFCALLIFVSHGFLILGTATIILLYIASIHGSPVK
jgi:hypothetical protein